MGDEMTRTRFWLALCCGWSVHGAHADVLPRPAQATQPTLNLSSDSDGLEIQKMGLGWLYRFEHAQAWHGLSVMEQRFKQGQQRRSGQEWAWVTQQLDPATANGHQLKLGINTGLGKDLWVFDGAWSFALGPQTRWEWFASQDRVDSIAAIDANTHHTLVGAAWDQRLNERLTAVLSAHHTRYSDEGRRDQVRGKLIWDAWPAQGVTLQGWVKAQEGNAVSRSYFNPETLQEYQAVLGVRQRWQGSTIAARYGMGQQQTNGSRWEPTHHSEIQITSPVRARQHWQLRWNGQKNWDITGPDYTYQALNIQWVLALD